METFIVRIYRRIAQGSRDAAGTVEHVETGERVGFTDAEELVQRLLGAPVHLHCGHDSGPEELP
ncbi:MAG TPA: hypothetical protein VFC24_17690 [Casimicrobiaceae bacterium]|nr:hypothetical protein [Casimicrobiaceae bacterium]